MSHPALTGLWQMVRAETGGEDSSQLLALRVELELTATDYVVTFAGEVADRGAFTLVGDTLTLVGSAGPNAGRTIPCIFQHVGDRLRVCYGLAGTPPTTFVTTPGSPLYVATYRRKP